MGLGSLGKTRVLVNTGTVAEGDSIAAYLTDAAGNLLTSTLAGGNQALDVNINNGVYAEDSAHTTADLGFAVWAVRNDAGTALAGTDGDYIPFSTDASGNLRVTGTFTSNAEFAEDSAHTSTDLGNYVLSVRQDTAGTAVSADGDYASFQQTADGYLRTLGIAETAILQQTVSVGLTATQLPATNLTNRKHITIQNVANGLVWIGSATVTAAGATAGLILARGGTYEADASAAVDIYGITLVGAKDCAVVELS
jgi:hypothetical protein